MRRQLIERTRNSVYYVYKSTARCVGIQQFPQALLDLRHAESRVDIVRPAPAQERRGTELTQPTGEVRIHTNGCPRKNLQKMPDGASTCVLRLLRVSATLDGKRYILTNSCAPSKRSHRPDQDFDVTR